MAYFSLLMMYSFIMIDMAVNIKHSIIFSLPSYIVSPVSPASIQEHSIRPVPDERLSTGMDVPFSNMDISNNFERQFEEILSNPNAYTNFAALVVKDGNVYCSKSQLRTLSRARYYVQMLQEGLRQRKGSTNLQMTPDASNLIPVLIKHDDSNGCYPSKQHDKYMFPRLAWSIPLENDDNWCAVVGMPSYKAWRDFSKRTIKGNDKYWQSIFQSNDKEYPWKDKLNMAVWRGATTFNKGLYGHLEFDDIPRAQLVEKARESRLIDAAFHKLVGKYEDDAQTSRDVRKLVKESIPLKDMMRYKGEPRDY